jgi:quercetin dioxygenase-like cupin family protein
LKRVALALLASAVYGSAAAQGASLQSPITIERLAQSTSSWDGAPYEAYPSSQSQITVLQFTIAPHTVMTWHSHPMPSAGYVLAGELTIEKRDGTKKHFVAGQVVTETVRSIHRGVTGSEPVVLIVFYPRAPGLSVSMPQEPGSREHEVGQ